MKGEQARGRGERVLIERVLIGVVLRLILAAPFVDPGARRGMPRRYFQTHVNFLATFGVPGISKDISNRRQPEILAEPKCNHHKTWPL